MIAVGVEGAESQVGQIVEGNDEFEIVGFGQIEQSIDECKRIYVGNGIFRLAGEERLVLDKDANGVETGFPHHREFVGHLGRVGLVEKVLPGRVAGIVVDAAHAERLVIKLQCAVGHGDEVGSVRFSGRGGVGVGWRVGQAGRRRGPG